MGIVKSYDVRGIYPDELNDAAAYALSRAFADLLTERAGGKQRTITIGRDMRQSSQPLETAVVRGLLDAGANVVRFGLVSTPSFYFGTAYFSQYHGGIQITASHNPSNQNGLKFVTERSVPLDGETGLEDIGRRADAKRFSQAQQTGAVTDRNDITETAANEFLQPIRLPQSPQLRVVADAGNGMGALDMAATFNRLPVVAQPMFFRLDGTFPNHSPDPSIDANLIQLQRQIVEEKADCGFASDGDGDRYFVVDETGHVVPHAILRGLVAQVALKRHPGAKVCFDVRPGRITKEMIESAGGVPVVTAVGRSFIERAMLKEDASVGAESSGHFFYKFSFGTFEAPAFFLGSFLQFLVEQQKPLSQIIAPYKKYAHSGEMNIPSSHPDAVINHIRLTHADGEHNELDGISVVYPDWWFNLRPSNTEPLVRLTVEAITREAMEKGRDRLLREIAEAK